MTRFGMVLDLHRCIGCHTCSVSCKLANNLSDKTWWNRVTTDGGDEMDTAAGEFPNLWMQHISISCQHCDNPACVKVCPVGATYKREEDGVVFQDYDKCIGCRMCIAACPYTGVRSFNWDEPAYSVDVAVGDSRIPAHQKHTVEKCTLCAHRIADGEEPACIASCPTYARHFGDFNDPESQVSKLISNRAHFQLLPERGTNPSVYFLV